MRLTPLIIAAVFISTIARAEDTFTFRDFMDHGNANGYQTYWNWLEYNGETHLVGAYLDENGDVIEDAEFDSETESYITGNVYYDDPEEFDDWYDDVIGGGSSPRGCEILNTCLGYWKER